MSERLSLAGLIDRIVGERPPRDPALARSLAATLDAQSPHIGLPSIDSMGLVDVIVTLRMDAGMALVVTGNLHPEPGEVTIHYTQADLLHLEVELTEESRPEPYIFATLDHSWRGRAARLLEGDELVEIRALATIGSRVQWRARTSTGETLTIGEDALELVDLD